MCAVAKGLASTTQSIPPVGIELIHQNAVLCSLIPFQKAFKPNETKANHFSNQYRRKNTNQGQNKHLKQKTIKKTKKHIHDKHQNLSKKDHLC